MLTPASETTKVHKHVNGVIILTISRMAQEQEVLMPTLMRELVQQATRLVLRVLQMQELIV